VCHVILVVKNKLAQAGKSFGAYNLNISQLAGTGETEKAHNISFADTVERL